MAVSCSRQQTYTELNTLSVVYTSRRVADMFMKHYRGNTLLKSGDCVYEERSVRFLYHTKDHLA